MLHMKSSSFNILVYPCHPDPYISGFVSLLFHSILTFVYAGTLILMFSFNKLKKQPRREKSSHSDLRLGLVSVSVS